MDPSTPTDLANRVRINVRLSLSKSQYKYGIYYKDMFVIGTLCHEKGGQINFR
jgi:hypothetical protein